MDGQSSVLQRLPARVQCGAGGHDVVDDQHGQPTWTRDLAAFIYYLVQRQAPFGTYHGTSGHPTTWCGFARAIFAHLGADPARVQPCTTAEFPRPAARPAYSVLSPASWRAAGLTPMRPWEAALDAYFAAE